MKINEIKTILRLSKANSSLLRKHLHKKITFKKSIKEQNGNNMKERWEYTEWRDQ